MDNGVSLLSVVSRSLPVTLLSLVLVPGQAKQAPGQSSQIYQRADDNQSLYRIAIEDPNEAGLIEQQLKLKPVLVESGSFYYHGDGKVNELLRGYGYVPRPVNREVVLTRLVKVSRKKGSEEDLTRAGVTIVLRERNYWIARATLAQVQLLERLGFAMEKLGHRELHPRQIRIAVARREQIAEVGALRVDIYSTTKSEKEYVIRGAAFDDSIDELKAAGFKVEILTDPPGVVR